MSIASFFWRYLRSYTAWAVLAGAGILVYAGATAASAALIKPIFAEVLLAGDRMPAGLSMLNAPAKPEAVEAPPRRVHRPAIRQNKPDTARLGSTWKTLTKPMRN